MPNRAPLTRDYQMYYKGTLVCRRGANGIKVMSVREVTHEGDDRDPHNVIFHGHVYNHNGERVADGLQTWRGDQFEVIIPKSGYYRIAGMTSPRYLELNVQNRTNKRGLDLGSLLYREGGQPNAGHVALILNSSDFPGQYSRDMCVHNNNILWKGEQLGVLHDGVVTMNSGNEAFEELVCKHLGNSLGQIQVRYRGK